MLAATSTGTAYSAYFDSATEAFQIVHPHRDGYFSLRLKDLLAMKRSWNEARKMLAKAEGLAKTEAQTAELQQMSDMHDKLYGGGPATAPSYQFSENVTDVAGYPCKKGKVLRDSVLIREVCVARHDDLQIDAVDQHTLAEMNRVAFAIANSVRAGAAQIPRFALDVRDGVPVSSTYLDQPKRPRTLRLFEIVRKDIPPATFEIPARLGRIGVPGMGS